MSSNLGIGDVFQAELRQIVLVLILHVLTQESDGRLGVVGVDLQIANCACVRQWQHLDLQWQQQARQRQPEADGSGVAIVGPRRPSLVWTGDLSRELPPLDLCKVHRCIRYLREVEVVQEVHQLRVSGWTEVGARFLL